MGFKIVRLQTIYSSKYIEEIYFKNKSLQNESYETQNAFIMNLVMDWPAKAFVKDFRNFGNEAEVIFWNNLQLQKKWALENNIKFKSNNINVEIILAQLKKMKPDVILFMNTASLPKSVRKDIKRIVPSIKLSVINEDFPGAFNDYSDADVFIVTDPILQKRYFYLKPYLIYSSFDPSILDNFKNSKQKKEYNLGFLGSLRFPESRYFFIKKLHQKFDFNIWTKKTIDEKLRKRNYKKISSIKLILFEILFAFFVFRKIIFFLNKFLKIKKINETYNLYDLSKTKKREIPSISLRDIEQEDFNWLRSKNIYSEKYGLDYYEVLNKTKIALNRHTDFQAMASSNMKMFEITGMGACLVTENSSNLKDLYKADTEVVTYNNYNEAKEKIKFLLDNPKICSEIAKAGQKKTLSSHTTFHRDKQLNDIITKHLYKK